MTVVIIIICPTHQNLNLFYLRHARFEEAIAVTCGGYHGRRYHCLFSCVQPLLDVSSKALVG